MEAVILVGIQGSGKSTFCREQFFNTHLRLNLDMLKTRNRLRRLMQVCLETRQRFVIDNTNVTRTERAEYVAKARASGFTVTCYFFPPDLQRALRWNRQRVGAAAIPEKGVCATLRRLEAPRLEEGFDALYSVILNSSGAADVQRYGDPADA